MCARTLALTFVLLVAIGCHAIVDPGGVRIEGPSVSVGDYRSHTSSGHFCPPGQAKKGRC